MEEELTEGQSSRSRLRLWGVICGLLVAAAVSLLVVLPFLPSDARVNELIEKGIQEYESRDFEEAEKTFKRVVQMAPKRGKAYNYLGVMAQDRKDFEEAEAYFRKAIEVDPMTSANSFNLSLLYYRLERYDEAEVELKEAMRLIAPKASYLLFYADIGSKRGLDSTEVIRRLRLTISAAVGQANGLEAELLARTPSILHAWVQAGKKLLEMNDTRGLKTTAQQYVEAKEPHLREFIGKALEQMGGFEALLVVLEEEDVEARRTAHAAMEGLSGKTVPFDVEASAEVRSQAVAALRKNLDHYRKDANNE